MHDECDSLDELASASSASLGVFSFRVYGPVPRPRPCTSFAMNHRLPRRPIRQARIQRLRNRAAELELDAEKTLAKAESARRFREAGDRYIVDYGDYSAALRCYRNFLDEADPADLAVSPNDTWLLTSLKRAREQENSQ